MLKIYPIVIAISFSVEKEEKIKYLYLLSQELMRVVVRKVRNRRIYNKYNSNGLEAFTAKVDIGGRLIFYGDTCYGKFDDYLISSFIDN